MGPRNVATRTTCVRLATGLAVLLCLCGVHSELEAAGKKKASVVSPEYADARAIFLRYRAPGTPGEAGGDGLGPLYNENSCVGCHNQGGPGGGGSHGTAVTLVTASTIPSLLSDRRDVFFGELEDLHPGFKTQSTVVLHKHAVSKADEEQLQRLAGTCVVQTRDGLFALHTSMRGTPALFGAGLIDEIPDKVLLEAEKRTFAQFPEIKGRVSHVTASRLGRFGWKGQTSRLEDFVLGACANELGLEVPGKHQPTLVSAEKYDPKRMKLDLDVSQCQLLTRYVASLPRPVVRNASDGFTVARGEMVFRGIGCAGCHVPDLGSLKGLYSDLLLHDLGEKMQSFGFGYGGGGPRVIDMADGKKSTRPTSGEAGPTEWRTTPLWGVASSAPYLHDDRAENLDDAIRLHGGEAEPTTQRYQKLEKADRQALLAFLKSLVAPQDRSATQSVASHSVRKAGSVKTVGSNHVP